MKHRYWLLVCAILLCLVAFGCSDDDTYINAAEDVLPVLEEPTGPDGSYKISLAGGDCTGSVPLAQADGGYGGEGGHVDIVTHGNTGLYVKTRELDDSFTVPEKAWEDDLGDNGVTISETKTIEIYVDDTLVEGDLYLLEGYEYLYQYVSGDPWDYVNRATGLKVAADATLTLECNYWGSEGVNLFFEDDVVINGTVTTANLIESPDKGALVITTFGHFTTGADSLIDTSGDSGSSEGDRGGNGGLIDIDAASGIILAGKIDASGGNGNGASGGNAGYGPGMPGVSIATQVEDDRGHSSVINSGPIDASGGSGDWGGNGAFIRLEGGFELYNAGDLDADGGEGSDFEGGRGGHIMLVALDSALYNSGDCYARGGDGNYYEGGGGGTGGTIRLISEAAYFAGNLINSGDLIIDGGDAKTAGNGGRAGIFSMNSRASDMVPFIPSVPPADIAIVTFGGDLLTTGDLSANGGDAAGEDYYGGSGGSIRIAVSSSSEVASGLLQVTGNISADGGDGDASGGSGGGLSIRDWPLDMLPFEALPPPVKPNELLGYGEGIDLSGGDSTWYRAGDGGGLSATTSSAEYADIDYPTGALVNRVDILATGGEGYDSAGGGEGGRVNIGAGGGIFQVFDDDREPEDFRPDIIDNAYVGTTVALNSGDINISGGDGYGGEDGGEFYLYGHDYAENKGNIDASGGDNGDDAGEYYSPSGGDGGDVEISSAVDVLNEGNVVATGGNATGMPYEEQQTTAKLINGDDDGHVFGGCGGWMELSGIASTTNNGDVDLSGGDSDNDIGGEGGAALIGTANSIEGPSVNTGTITVDGGTGPTENGPDGFIWVDGFVVGP